jgi:multidrug efflux pump subunit AcrA (membrane-fusion protein)
MQLREEEKLARFEQAILPHFSGKTQPVPGRVAKIAPVVLHPVTEVLVVPGTRVKKGQPLVRIDDDEAKADVRNKEAALKELCTSLKRFQAEPRQQEQEEAKDALPSKPSQRDLRDAVSSRPAGPTQSPGGRDRTWIVLRAGKPQDSINSSSLLNTMSVGPRFA